MFAIFDSAIRVSLVSVNYLRLYSVTASYSVIECNVTCLTFLNAALAICGRIVSSPIEANQKANWTEVYLLKNLRLLRGIKEIDSVIKGGIMAHLNEVVRIVHLVNLLTTVSSPLLQGQVKVMPEAPPRGWIGK